MKLPEDPQARARLISLAWILVPSAVVALAVLGLFRWRVPTAVEIDVSVRRAQLRTHGADLRVLLDSAQVLDQGLLGRPVSTLTGPGTVRYVDHSGIEPVQVSANDFLVLGGLRDFLLRQVELMEHKGGLRLLFRGVAGRVSSGPENSTRDLRLTQFDILWRNRALVALFAVLGWLVPTLLGIRRFFRELRR